MVMPTDTAAAAAAAASIEIEAEKRRRRRMPRFASTHRVPMMMTTTGFTGVVAVVVVVAMMMMMDVVVDSSSIASSTQDGAHLRSSSRSSDDIYREEDDEDDDKHIDCQSEHGSCLSDQHCCHGYVCSRDPAQESGSEVGICDRDPNLSLCHSDDQCSHGSQCIDSDQTGQGFCSQRVGLQTEEEEEEEQRHKDWSQHMYHERRGGLGSSCESTSDCNAFTMDGTESLCCQDVRRGRQGTKRMCDRVTGISVCIQ